MNFEYAPEFKKELKHFQKKWRSLSDDILDAERQITDLYNGEDGDVLKEYRAAFFNGKRATILRTLDDGREVVKMRLDVEVLGTNSKVRLVFIAIKQQGSVVLIELFAKNEKPREDPKRIEQYL